MVADERETRFLALLRIVKLDDGRIFTWEGYGPAELWPTTFPDEEAFRYAYGISLENAMKIIHPLGIGS